MSSSTVPFHLRLFLEKMQHAFPGQLDTFTLDDENANIQDCWLALSSHLKCSAERLAAQLSESSGVPLADPELLARPNAGLIAKLPYAQATRSSVLPLKLDNGNLLMAFANPFNLDLQKDMQFATGFSIAPALAPPDLLDSSIATAYEEQRDAALHAQDKAHIDELNDRRIPKLAAEFLNRSIRQKASDIHMQPVSGGVAVRIRVDGVLRRLVIMPREVGSAVIRFFKAQSKMDPTNNNIPQDGRMSWEVGERKFDLRVSTLPVSGKQEKLVVRILNQGASVTLQQSGMSLAEIHTLRRMAGHPSGVVLLCGPTGSGKTTTLYSILSEVNEVGISIATVENPVEYRMSGLAQTEVNATAGMTFAAALRSILRQDPDVILIGEIRDHETAEIAMQSAMTGHLVFSTLHTNAAVTAIARLLDLNIAAPVLSEAIVGIVSQRLLRRLCPECKKPLAKAGAPEDKHFEKITQVLPGAMPVGCKACAYTGYRGRVVVTEMIEINSALMQLIAAGETSSEKLLAACDKSFMPISIAATRRIISGDSSVAEAHRVLGKRFWMDLTTEYGGEIPDLASLNVSRAGTSSSKAGVMLVGSSFGAQFIKEMEDAWFTVFQASTPEDAKNLLEQHSEIEFVVVDLPAGESDASILNYVSTYRKAMAWTRLPALLLTPEDKPQWQEQLKAHGATSRFLPRNTPVHDIAELIHDAVADNLDYRWGVEKSAKTTQ